MSPDSAQNAAPQVSGTQSGEDNQNGKNAAQEQITWRRILVPLLPAVGTLFMIYWSGFNIVKKPLTFASTHLIDKEITGVLDSSYIAFDSTVHPMHHFVNEGSKYIYGVANHKFKFKAGDPSFEFQGILPWQNSEVCSQSYLDDDTNKPVTQFEDWLEEKNYNYKLKRSEAGSINDNEQIVSALYSKNLVQTDESRHQFARAKDVCKFETWPESMVVVNDLNTFALTSAHNELVLVQCILAIIFMSYTMHIKKILKEERKMFTNDEKDFDRYVDYSVLLLVSLALLVAYWNYGDDMAYDTQIIMPNASFAYGFLAILYSWMFLRYGHFDQNNYYLMRLLTPKAKRAYAVVQPFVQPTVDAAKSKLHKAHEFVKSKASHAPANDRQRLLGAEGSTMHYEINLSNFSKKTVRSDAYMQAGNLGRYDEPYEDSKVQLFGSDLISLNQDHYEKANVHYSHFQMTQLWVLPLLLLSMYITDKNFDIDIHLTLVFSLSMLYCILDVFSRRMLVMNSLLRDLTDDAMPWMVELVLVIVQFVSFLVQLGIVIYLLHFFQEQKRDEFMHDNKNFIIFYFAFGLAYKVYAVSSNTYFSSAAYKNRLQGRTEPKNYDSSNPYWFHYEYINIFVLTLITLIIVSKLWMFNNNWFQNYGFETWKCWEDDNSAKEGCKFLLQYMQNHELNSAAAYNFAK